MGPSVYIKCFVCVCVFGCFNYCYNVMRLLLRMEVELCLYRSMFAHHVDRTHTKSTSHTAAL